VHRDLKTTIKEVKEVKVVKEVKSTILKLFQKRVQQVHPNYNFNLFITLQIVDLLDLFRIKI